MISYIEVSVNKEFCFCTVLGVSNVNPYHGHIGFGGSLDNTREKG